MNHTNKKTFHASSKAWRPFLKRTPHWWEGDKLRIALPDHKGHSTLHMTESGHIVIVGQENKQLKQFPNFKLI